MEELYAIYGFYRLEPIETSLLLNEGEKAQFKELFNRPLKSGTDVASSHRM